MSPFSHLCGYSVTQFARAQRGQMNLSPRDQTLICRIRLAGAAAFFQICERKRDRNKLKTLGRVGVLNLYRLEGQYRMNVASWEPLSLDQLLRSLVLAQFLLLSGAVFNGQQVIFNGRAHELIIVRHGDAVPVERLERANCCLILAEEYAGWFDHIPSPAKILLDEDLISNHLNYIDTGMI